MSLAVGKTSFAVQLAEMIESDFPFPEYEVVNVQVNKGKMLTVKVFVGRKDYQKMTVDECTKVSRQVAAILDGEDIIQSEYMLEVSSPGIDRYLVKVRDFEFYLNYEIKIKTKSKIQDKKNFKGVLIACNDKSVTIQHDEVELEFPFDVIEEAKLTLSDKLLNDRR